MDRFQLRLEGRLVSVSDCQVSWERSSKAWVRIMGKPWPDGGMVRRPDDEEHREPERVYSSIGGQILYTVCGGGGV